ncbi:DUF4157 domain-containing protein [Tahibacter sp.]|uniref:eCIS core domain-containing protein n=1 Tax=Tahibacter sp. TaxID=2056211 RepID=UPI0028C48280|nr:DUF4157 domain-containing protein [Tahibacter sp.]
MSATRAIAAPAPARRKAAPVSVAAAPAGMAETAAPLQAPPMLQRRCACGGSCPRCSNDEPLLQPRLRVGAVDDVYEREADRIAGRLVEQAPPPGTSGGADAPGSGTDALAPPGAAADALQPERLSAGGEPLAPALRGYFEPRLGRDLSDVRIHSGAESAAYNRHVNAYAFTYGNHVWLGAGQRPAVDFVLAHELAHVVQQGGARPLPAAMQGQADGGGAKPDAHPATGLRSDRTTLRRLALETYWIPLGAKGKLTGTDLHKQLLANATGANLDTEAPAPNANLGDHGLDLRGSIDLYTGAKGSSFHHMAGLYFAGPVGAKNADVQATTPKKHPRVRATAVGATYAPSVSRDGKVENIADGPQEIQLGELKPASAPMLARAPGQLQNYIEGFKDAARLTNTLGAARKPAVEWKLKEPTLLPDSAVKFVDNGRDMKFDPASPRNDTSLVLGKIEESNDVGAKYTVKVIYDPARHGHAPIMGGLYAQSFKPNTGLWMYFARPQNLDAILKTSRASRNTKGEMQLANQVQDQVLDPLFEAPKQVAPLRRPAAAGTPTHAQQAATPPTQESATLRRKGKKPPPKLEDKFVFKTWQSHVTALRTEVTGSKDATRQKEMASLELLQHAYAADDSLAAAGTRRVLPDKSSDKVNIVSHSGKTKGAKDRSHSKDLGDVSGWLRAWTGRPVEQVLGRFRERFGGAFVWVADKVATLREKVRKTLADKFKSGSKGGGGGKARMILKALGKALLQMGKVLLHRTVGLIVTALENGIRKKLDKLFDIEPEKLLEDTFGKDFDALAAPLQKIKTDAEAKLDAAVAEYSAKLDWIADIKDLSSTIGPIVEVASIAAQCASPPGWGCLKLLARKLTDCAIDAALNICWVQKRIAGAVEEINAVANIPTDVAELALKQLKKLAPKELEDVFDEPVPRATSAGNDEIECEDSPPDSGCPSLGGSGGSGSGGDTPAEPTDPVYDDLLDLRKEHTPEQIAGAAEMAEAAGMPQDAPLTPEQVRKMKELLGPSKGMGAQDFSDMANGQAGQDVKDKLQPLQDYLDKQASDAIKDQLLKDLKDGKFDAKHKDMAQAGRHWRILKPYKKGTFKNYPVLVWTPTQSGAGVTDGSMGECFEDGKIPVDFTRADIVDKDGKPMPIDTPIHIPDGQLDSKACPGDGKGKTDAGDSDASGSGHVPPEPEPDASDSTQQHGGTEPEPTPQPTPPDVAPEAGDSPAPGGDKKPGGGAKPGGGQGSTGGSGGSNGGGRGKPGQRQNSDTWVIYGAYAQGAFTRRSVRAWLLSTHQHASGRVDGRFIECFGDFAKIEITGASLTDMGSNPVTVPTPQTVANVRLADGGCPPQAKKPRPKPQAGGGTSKVCLDGTSCGSSYPIIFEEFSSSDLKAGWLVFPDPSVDPNSTYSLLHSTANPNGQLEVAANADGGYDVFRRQAGGRVLVGKAKKTPNHYELLSGDLFDQLQKALENYVAATRNGGNPDRSTRLRFR